MVHRLRRLRDTFGGFESAESAGLTAAEIPAIVLLHSFVSALKSMERVKGIEPSSQAWEALPSNHTRKRYDVVTACRDSAIRIRMLPRDPAVFD